MYYKNISSSALLAMFTVSGLLLSDAADAGISYRKAIYVEKQHCKNRFPATKRYAKSRFSLVKGGCWSCPKGFKRTGLPAPDKHKSCKKPRPYTNAIFHSNARGVFNNVCKGKPWMKNKKCWTCPEGFKRSLKEVGGKPQCKPRTKNYYHPATRRGGAGCGRGLWSPSFNNNCYKCPSGYIRNLTRVSRKRSKDPKACVSFALSKKGQRSFIARHKREAERRINKDPELIKLAGQFVKNITPVVKKRGGIRKLTKSDLRAAGLQRVLVESCKKGYGSVSIMGGADLALIGGANGSAGIATGFKAECGDTEDGNDWIDNNTDFGIKKITSFNWQAGFTAGGDLSINFGFWKPQYDELAGPGHGVVLGGSYAQYGVTGSAWWTRVRGRNNDEFVGISLGYQGGLSAEIEYNWGWTWQ